MRSPILIILTICAGCAQAPLPVKQEVGLSPEARNIASDNRDARHAAFARLLARGDAALPVLVELARQKDDRLAVPGILGLTVLVIEGQGVVAPLVEVLDSGSPTARILAARAFCLRMGKPAEEARPVLERAAKSNDPRLRELATKAVALFDMAEKFTVDPPPSGLQGPDLEALLAPKKEPSEAERHLARSLFLWFRAREEGRQKELGCVELRLYDRLGRVPGPEDDVKTIEIEMMVETLARALRPTIAAIERHRQRRGAYPAGIEEFTIVDEHGRARITLPYAPVFGQDHAWLLYFPQQKTSSYVVGGQMYHGFQGFKGYRGWELQFLWNPEGIVDRYPDPERQPRCVFRHAGWTVWHMR